MSGGVSADTIVAAVAGLFGGAIGGLLTVVPITRLTERTKERRAAERAIAGVVNEYTARFVHDHDRLFIDSAFPLSYSSIKGQEQLAREILVHTDSLSTKKSRRVRAEVEALVGKFSFSVADRQVHLPVDLYDRPEEHQRQALELHRIIHESPNDERGLLGTVLRTQNEGSRQADYEIALRSLEAVRSLVT